ncbi:hypothetical protein [Paenibacillus sp. UASWS1643]|uniref:hypothetical protein n=1 Tax=Paenibacillus sp. UASWS1643 TaxID=2580422 RepID=UPI0012390E14|nr:hypothetical protein [Paenibacillus sp. UASWS1643]KAA8750125.1 hypothetical protein FE296_16140 [Paenibacillus sp. UASWS1643]
MYEIGVVVAVIIAIGEFAKLYVAAKWIPLLSMALGLGAGLFYIPVDSVADGIMTGLMTGLAACKLYDIGRRRLRKLRDARN